MGIDEPVTGAWFAEHVNRWGLIPDGDPIVTAMCRLLPVRYGGKPAMLKVALDAEERFGGVLLAWWDGQGAARVLEHHDGVVLMERAMGNDSLLQMALNGQDDEASRIVAQVAAQLHAPRAKAVPAVLVPMERWLDSLWAVEGHNGMFQLACDTARELLASMREIVPLHGDLHHGNVLDFGARGWVAIDPKRVIGERSYDYVHVLCNEELETVCNPERFKRQVNVIADAAGLEKKRLLQWVLAYSGLSAAWFLEDNDVDGVETALTTAQLAAAELGLALP